MHLNYLPLKFSATVFQGGIICFEEDSRNSSSEESPLSIKLNELRQQYNETHFFARLGNSIACIGLSHGVPLIGEPKEFDIHKDFQLANMIARSALFRFFKASDYLVTGFRPVTLIKRYNLASKLQDIFGIFPEYTFDIRPLAPHEGDITSGVLVGFGIRYVFLQTVSALHAKKVLLEGLYAVRIHENAEFNSPLERKYLGRIEHIKDGRVFLTDSDINECPLEECYLEGSRKNVEVVGKALLNRDYEAFSHDLLNKTYDIMGAEHQVKRLNQLGKWLQEKSPIPCSTDLNIEIHNKPHNCPRGTDAGYSHVFNTPRCVLRPGGATTVPWPVDKEIDRYGPYDAESFPNKRIKIAVILHPLTIFELSKD